MFTNCFAYRKYINGQEECSILTENICQNRNCSFYKTAKEYVKGFQNHKDFEKMCRIYDIKFEKKD